ncbi:MAG: VWA domain-containing protein [Bacillota bacterium]
MVLEFADPRWLLLLALLVPTVWLWRPNPWFLARARHRLVLGLRVAVIIAVVAALAGAQWRQALRDETVVFVVDVSDSVGHSRKAAEDFIREALAKKGPRDRAAVIAVGREAMVDLPVDSTVSFDRVEATPDSHFTDLAAGLRLAEALYPRDTLKRLVLLSDGRQNVEDAMEEARAMKARGIRLDVVALNPGQGPEVLVERVVGPNVARQGDVVDLTVEVSSNVNTTGILRLFRDREQVAERSMTIAKGTNRIVVTVPGLAVGLHSLTATIDPAEDTMAVNNEGAVLVNVIGPPEVLLVEGQPGESANLTSALRSRGMKVTVRQPALFPPSLTELRQYASVVLVDVPATDLAPKTMEMIRSYVRDLGQGLVMVGGPDSFGPGGYYRTPVEEALPVTMDLHGKGDLPSLGLVLVVDKSGSMTEGSGGFTKVDLAKEAAMRATEVLSPKDQVGVVAFDDSAKWVVDLQSPADLDRIQDDIGTIRAGGGTDIYPAVNLAYQALAKASIKLKHIIVMTDGMSGAGGDYEDLAKKMAEKKITLSTVAVGNDADVTFLQTLARLGNGRYYYTDDLPSIPKIFTKETILATRSFYVEEPFTPAVTGSSPILNGLNGLPELGGYVATSPKGAAEVVLTSHKDDPVLAQWRYGLGRAAAYTSDVKGQWSGQWVAWDGFARFWSNLVAWTLPEIDDGALRLESTASGGEGRIVLETPYELTRTRPTRATVVDPALGAHQVELAPISPGRYEGRFEAAMPGVYLIQAVQQEAGAVQSSGLSGLAVPYSPEYRPSPVDPAFLDRLAAAAGGTSLKEPGEAFARNLPPGRGRTEAWPFLLALAALLMPFDVAARRLFVSRADLEAWRERLIVRRKRSAVEASTETMTRLRSRKTGVELSRQKQAPTGTRAPAPPGGQPGPARPASPPGRPGAAQPKPAEPARQAAEADGGHELTARLLAAKRRRGK